MWNEGKTHRDEAGKVERDCLHASYVSACLNWMTQDMGKTVLVTVMGKQALLYVIG